MAEPKVADTFGFSAIHLFDTKLNGKIRMVSGTVSDFDRCFEAQRELCEGARHFQSLEVWPSLPFTARVFPLPHWRQIWGQA